MDFLEQIFNGTLSVRDINDTLIVLIPKVPNPEFLHNFPPISLCNVSYKLITKLIANRIWPVISHLVAPNQSSFVPGRHIQDNIIIAQELIHSMDQIKGRR